MRSLSKQHRAILI